MKTIILLLFFNLCFSLELQKPQLYNEEDNIKGWVMSEKLDGIRAFWNGKELQTRKGNVISAPKWFINQLPPFELDGELWTKRSDFENIQNIVMDKIPSEKWSEITYNIFEVPNSEKEFLHRLEILEKWLKNNPRKNIKVIKQIPINDKKELDDFLEKVLKLKGEGVIIKDPNQKYHTGRSPYILKVKKFYDMEGVVVGINYNQDSKKLKSLKIKIENGIEFNLGTGFSDVQRLYPPKIGEIITFKYYGFTKNGIPKFASFLHIRED